MRIVMLGLGAALLVGCGGKAVVDGSAGAGGGTTSSETSSTTATDTTATTSGAGGSAPAGCTQACGAMSTTPWCSAGGSCIAECQQALSSAGSCVIDGEDAVACMAAQAESTNCWFEGTCQPLTAAWGNCIGYPGHCDTQVGTGDAQSCASSMSCNGVLFEARCSYYDLAVDCVCSIAGFPVGLCAGSGDFPCDLLTGCCAAYF